MPYICGKCGREIKDEDLIGIQGVRCRCGSRILYKARPPVTKKILAR